LTLPLSAALDITTGCVFEAKLKSGGDSIAGGGRYDHVIGSFTGRTIRQSDFSLGIERILNILKEKDYVQKIICNYFVASTGDELKLTAIKIAEALRAEGKNVETDVMGRNFSNQMKYANNIGAEKVVIVGQKEIKMEKSS